MYTVGQPEPVSAYVLGGWWNCLKSAKWTTSINSVVATHEFLAKQMQPVLVFDSKISI